MVRGEESGVRNFAGVSQKFLDTRTVGRSYPPASAISYFTIYIGLRGCLAAYYLRYLIIESSNHALKLP